MFNPDNEEEILCALKDGDEEAFLKIYETYWHEVFQVAYRRIGKKDIAEELTQELFLKLWERRHVLRPLKIRNYLLVSIKNAVIDHIHAGLLANKYSDFYRAFADLSSQSTQNTVEFDDLSDAIEKALLQLPVKTQEVFKLSRLDNWTSDRIAKHLNLSEKTVGYHLTKSLKIIRTDHREYILLAFAVVVI